MYQKIIPLLSRYFNAVFLVVIYCFLFSCSDSHREAIPDVSNINVDLKLIRFDQEFFQLDTQKPIDGLKKLINKYPSFCKLYFSQILSIPEYSDSVNSNFLDAIRQMLEDSSVIELNNQVQKMYASNELFDDKLKHSLQYMKYYFPQEMEPVFYTLISEFSYGNFIFQESKHKDGIGISLEFFLGPEFDYKSINPDNPAFSSYLSRSFNKDHLLKKTWEVWLDDRITKPDNGRLLDYMIQNGKKLYALTKILPDIQDTVLFEYSSKQMNWCKQNKVEIWAYFLSNNLLYSTELLKFNKFISPSPNSPGMPQDAPGETGNYIGYEIVKAYMNRNSQSSIQDLFKQTDSQGILNESRFKPKDQ